MSKDTHVTVARETLAGYKKKASVHAKKAKVFECFSRVENEITTDTKQHWFRLPVRLVLVSPLEQLPKKTSGTGGTTSQECLEFPMISFVSTEHEVLCSVEVVQYVGNHDNLRLKTHLLCGMG